MLKAHEVQLQGGPLPRHPAWEVTPTTPLLTICFALKC